MIISDFEQTNYSKRKHSPQRKKQYAGGFRGYHPSQKSLQQKPHESTVSEYVNRIGVSGLTELYEQSQQTINDKSILIANQKQSIVRLYKNIYPRKQRQKNDEQQGNNQNTNQSQIKQYIWQKDSKYEKFPHQFIIQKQMAKLNDKFVSQYKFQCKKKKNNPSPSFAQVLTGFLIENLEQLSKPVQKSGARQDSDLEIFFIWKNYLSQVNFRNYTDKRNNLTVQMEKFQSTIFRHRYFFTFFHHKVFESQKFENIIKFTELANIAEEGFDAKGKGKQILNKFNCNYTYTQPLKVQFEKKDKQQKIKKWEQEQNQDDIQLKKSIKAKPVPKTTYNDPKENTKPPSKTTEVVAFNVSSQPIKHKEYDEYYHWDSNFKANPIPETTYKPTLIKQLSENQKKAQALLKLQEAKYPQTMKNLNHLKSQKQHKKQQLTEKYQKHYQPIERKDIPNFEYLHAKTLLEYEQIQSNNKKNIKVQPFNLSQNRKTNNKQQNNNLQQDKAVRMEGRRQSRSKKTDIQPAKSTLKYESYVKFRSEDQKKRKQQMEKREIDKADRDKKTENLKSIMKARIAEELDLQPRPKNQYEKDKPYKVKIDYEKMYRQKPLLMKENNPKQIQLQWVSIFEEDRQ